MQIAFTVADDLAAGLGEDSDAISSLALESLAIEGYRSGKLSAFQVRQMLGHDSRWETERFLATHEVWPGTTVDELETGLRHLTSLSSNAAPMSK
jgi:hypothetical protein